MHGNHLVVVVLRCAALAVEHRHTPKSVRSTGFYRTDEPPPCAESIRAFVRVGRCGEPLPCAYECVATVRSGEGASAQRLDRMASSGRIAGVTGAEDDWDITRFQMRGLRGHYNLSDGHNRMSLSPDLQRDLGSGLLVECWRTATTSPYELVVADLLDALGDLLGPGFKKVSISQVEEAYASSISTQMLGGALADLQLRVGLVEPTFDNIYDLFRLANVNVVSIPEDLLFDGRLPWDSFDVLFIVDPNNPTGNQLGVDRMSELFSLADANGKICCIDRSFTLFPASACDVYELAADFPRLPVFTIEDTGKILPSLDQKVGLLVNVNPEASRSQDLGRLIKVYRSALLLNVSPFTLSVVTAFLRDARRDGLSITRRTIAEHRQFLRRAVQQTGIVPAASSIYSKSSVDLLDISALGLSAGIVANSLRVHHDVHVLPGDKFYWSSPTADSGEIRVSLARETSYFQEAVLALAKALAALAQGEHP